MANRVDANDAAFQAETKVKKDFPIVNTAMPSMTIEVNKGHAVVNTITPVTVKPLRETFDDSNSNLDKNFRSEFV
jgi:hypothetical protein